ncbi:MAG: hypothetical protein H6Q25_1612 [Bacteroidetes bacterium]|nr:hypothetical protein [Bacteroidota bacterium]
MRIKTQPIISSVQPEFVKIDTIYVNFTVLVTTYKLCNVQVSYDAVVNSYGEVKYGIRHCRNSSSSTLPNNSNNS